MFLGWNDHRQFRCLCYHLVGMYHLPQRITELLNGGEPVVSIYRQSTIDGAGYYFHGWHELVHWQERIRFSRAYSCQSIRSCRWDRTGQESVEDGTKSINIRTTTRSPVILFRCAKVEHTLLSGGVCAQVLDTTEINELRRSGCTSIWRDDIGQFDVTMDQRRMLSMQVAYSVHNG